MVTIATASSRSKCPAATRRWLSVDSWLPILVERRLQMIIDPTTEYGAKVDRHLKDEIVIWLTTVRPDGRPEPSPVWFYWDGATVLIYSMPGKTKLKAIASNPHVALNFK